MKVSIQNILFYCFTSQLLLKLAFWNLACSHKYTISNIFLEFSNFKIVGFGTDWNFKSFAVASSGWDKGVDPKLFHRVLLCEVKVLIQTFLFHCVLGEVKI